MLVCILAFSYVVGDLKHFFDLDALFNEFILGYILPFAMTIKDQKETINKAGLIVFMAIICFIHFWAIGQKIFTKIN